MISATASEKMAVTVETTSLSRWLWYLRTYTQQKAKIARSKRPKMHQPITRSAAAAAIFASGPDKPKGEGREGFQKGVECLPGL